MDTLVPLSEDWRPVEVAITPVAKTERPAILALLAMLAADLAIFVYVAIVGFVRQPYSDMFDFIRAEFALERSGDLLTYLATPHNSQFLVWIRVLTALDVQVFHGAGIIFALVSGAALALSATALGVQIWRSIPVRAVGAMAALLAAPLIVSTINTLGVTQPINAVYPLAFGFTALALIAFEQASATSNGLGWTSLAVLFGLMAVCGSAVGVTVWPVLVLSALRNSANRRRLAPVLLVGLAVTALVAKGLLGAPSDHATATGTSHVLKIIQYFVVYLGLPWSSVPGLSRIRLLIGMISLCVGGYLILRGSRRESSAGVLERVGVDLIAFSMLTAAMAAMGRVDQTVAVNVPVRYAIFMSAFQVGLVCIAALWLADHWASAKRYTVAASLAVAIALVAVQVLAVRSWLGYSHLVRSEITAFEAGVRHPGMRQMIYPDYDVALAVQAECRRRGIYQ